MAIPGQAAPPPRTSVLPDTPHALDLRAANYLDMFDLAFPPQELWDPDSWHKMFALLRVRGVEEVSGMGGQFLARRTVNVTVSTHPSFLASPSESVRYYWLRRHDALLCLQHWPLSSVGY